MDLDLLIRSFYRDLGWLRLCLKSLSFLAGYRRAVVVLPMSTLDRVDVADLASAPRVVIRACRDYPDGDYLGQQITKLHADRHTDADVIVHLDSDQLFAEPCDLSTELFDEDGRLRLGIGSDRPPGDGWARCPREYYGRPLDWDVPPLSPLALPRHVYAGLRADCAARHGMSIVDYARRATATRFSEHALLRAHALVTEPDRYGLFDVRERDLLPQCRTYSSRFDSRGQSPAEVA